MDIKDTDIGRLWSTHYPKRKKRLGFSHVLPLYRSCDSKHCPKQSLRWRSGPFEKRTDIPRCAEGRVLSIHWTAHCASNPETSCSPFIAVENQPAWHAQFKPGDARFVLGRILLATKVISRIHSRIACLRKIFKTPKISYFRTQ